MTSTFLCMSTEKKNVNAKVKRPVINTHPSCPSRRNPRYIAVNLLKPTRTNRNVSNLLPTIPVSPDFQFELPQSHPSASDKHLAQIILHSFQPSRIERREDHSVQTLFRLPTSGAAHSPSKSTSNHNRECSQAATRLPIYFLLPPEHTYPPLLHGFVNLPENYNIQWRA